MTKFIDLEPERREALISLCKQVIFAKLASFDAINGFLIKSLFSFSAGGIAAILAMNQRILIPGESGWAIASLIAFMLGIIGAFLMMGGTNSRLEKMYHRSILDLREFVTGDLDHEKIAWILDPMDEKMALKHFGLNYILAIAALGVFSFVSILFGLLFFLLALS